MLKVVKKRANNLFTPSYIYNKTLIIKNLSFLRKIFSSCNAEIFFAVKANTSISILKIIKEKGTWSRSNFSWRNIYLIKSWI